MDLTSNGHGRASKNVRVNKSDNIENGIKVENEKLNYLFSLFVFLRRQKKNWSEV